MNPMYLFIFHKEYQSQKEPLAIIVEPNSRIENFTDAQRISEKIRDLLDWPELVDFCVLQSKDEESARDEIEANLGLDLMFFSIKFT